MKLFKFIRDSLANIGFKASYQPKHDSIGLASEPTVKENEDKIVRQRVREAFAAQEKEMRLRSAKPHSFACEDNWTCKKNPCYVVEADVIVGSEIIPAKKRGRKMRTETVRDKDFKEMI